MSLDCAIFGQETSFASFIFLLESSTNGNLSLIQQCAPQVCQTLWGTGNPDISGVGMLVGYIMENALGPLFSTLLLYSTFQEGSNLAKSRQLIQELFDSFHECAVFLALSIQIACIVVLTRALDGIDQQGMGDFTTRITWTVAALTMIPLTYRTFWPVDQRKSVSSALFHQAQCKSMRDRMRFPLFTICWAINLFIFLSRMASTFGPSQIGSSFGSAGPGQVISSTDWEVIQNLCLAADDRISGPQEIAIDFFGIAASFSVSLLVLGRFMRLIGQAWGLERLASKAWRHGFDVFGKAASTFLLCLLFFLAIGLLWSLLTLQRLQIQLAKSIGANDDVGGWTFGQIVAVLVFAPVLVEGAGGVFITD